MNETRKHINRLKTEADHLQGEIARLRKIRCLSQHQQACLEQAELHLEKIQREIERLEAGL